MKYHDFLGQVQARGRLSSTEDAVKATRATLTVLATRLAGNEADDLAAQLPEEIGRFLTGHDETERFNVKEFFARVSEMEGVDLPQSIHHARAVVSVVQDAVAEGEIKDIRQQLPDDFGPLFDAGSEGRLNPAE